MKKSWVWLSVAITVIFWSCQQVSPIATPLNNENLTSIASETLIPTLVYDYRTYPKIENQPTITASPPSLTSSIFPKNLFIEEYQVDSKENTILIDNVYDRHPNSGGVYLYFHPKGGIIDGKVFQAVEKVVSNGSIEIHATINGENIAVIECGAASPSTSLITAWAYKTHWIIQSNCYGVFDIFWDGISLNESRGYKSSFAFQLIGGNPFYLFERDEQIWMFYEDKETLLNYVDVKLSYCCETYRPPRHYENMVTFYATKENQLYYVAIGLAEE